MAAALCPAGGGTGWRHRASSGTARGYSAVETVQTSRSPGRGRDAEEGAVSTWGVARRAEARDAQEAGTTGKEEERFKDVSRFLVGGPGGW